MQRNTEPSNLSSADPRTDVGGLIAPESILLFRIACWDQFDWLTRPQMSARRFHNLKADQTRRTTLPSRAHPRDVQDGAARDHEKPLGIPRFTSIAGCDNQIVGAESPKDLLTILRQQSVGRSLKSCWCRSR